MLRRVRWLWIILCASYIAGAARAEQSAVETDASAWASGSNAVAGIELRNWLDGFGEFDTERAGELLGQLRERIQGEYELDLAPVKGAARVLAVVLNGSEETRPYSSWLEARYRTWPDQFDFGFWMPKDPGLLDPGIPGVEPVKADVIPGLIEPRGADHFVPRLKPIFESMQVPTELVWVAEVESAFNPRAVSPVGAAGLYQLMPATARQYGLMLEPDDDRFDPEKNARAAARHMSYLSWLFDDWPLAMAAYNAGHNRVRRLLVKHNARSFEEIALYLPLETQIFVPKVDATLVRREGVSLEGLALRLP